MPAPRIGPADELLDEWNAIASGSIAGSPSTDTDPMDSAELPHYANQAIEYLAFKSRGYHGKLQGREVQRFKAALIKSPERWTRDRVPLRAFERRYLDAELSPADTSELVDLLRRAHKGDRMRVTSRFDRAAPIEVPDDWSPSGREDSD
jgi:hypothetical protein